MIGGEAMRSICQIVDSYRTPITYDLGSGYSYEAVTAYGEPSAEADIDAAWRGRTTPVAVRELWLSATWIHLYYRNGSEGLEVFSPRASRVATADRDVEIATDPDSNFRPGDVIVGKFQALDDSLVYSPADGWLVSKPYDPRDYWLHLGDTLNEFLLAYKDSVDHPGAWERRFPILNQ